MSISIQRRISIIESLINKRCISCFEKTPSVKCSICDENCLECLECLIDHTCNVMTNLDSLILDLYGKHIEDIEVKEIKDMNSYYEDIKQKLLYNITICQNCIDR